MSIPLNKVHHTADLTPRSRRVPGAAKPLVLVVEDHDDTCFLLTTLLEMRGCTAVVAGNGEEAVRLAESVRPDLILMDAGLPLLDGLAATRQIRASMLPDRVPIVFLSGHAEPAFRVVALAAGCDEYLVKPVRLEQIDRVLDELFGPDGGPVKTTYPKMMSAES
ncbi:MAG: response regulator [Pyrinomonadaceae bacterium]